ncbi:MAG: Rid family hydrolase [bacterium]|nr:Rid family hydrolase [bacterium]
MSNFPLSSFTQVGNIFFISGQIGQKDGQLVSDGIVEQTIQAIFNVKVILKQKGLGLENVVDVTAFLTDQNDYEEFNDAYRNGFKEPYPSRTTVTVKSLPLSARVELKVIAAK